MKPELDRIKILPGRVGGGGGEGEGVAGGKGVAR